jgi:hypothetical protein
MTSSLPFTAYPLSGHYLFTTYSLPIHCLFTAPAYSHRVDDQLAAIHCSSIVWSLPIHYLFATYSLPIHAYSCLFTAYSDDQLAAIHCLCIVQLLSIHCLSLAFSLPIHCRFTDRLDLRQTRLLLHRLARRQSRGPRCSSVCVAWVLGTQDCQVTRFSVQLFAAHLSGGAGRSHQH